jgi:transposase
MNTATLLADPAAIRLTYIRSAAASITIVVKTTLPHSSCPLCGSDSTLVHSRYVRRIADLPWQGVSVKLELHTRRFRCNDELCPRRIFCERLPQVVADYARKTVRLNDALRLIGFLIGGESGARAAIRLGIGVSPDTLIRRVRQTVTPMMPTPRVLGVDDWAKRKGRSYGTILVDLERRRPVDLLPDRETGTLAAWLKAHPGIEVVTRDRSRAYAEGITGGAPHALQVADRFHILKNLSEALERLLTRQHQFVRAAVQPPAASSQPLPLPQPQGEPPTITEQTFLPPLRPRPGVAERRDNSLASYKEVVRLKCEGLSTEEIAPRVGKRPRTVRHWLQPGKFRELRKHRRSRLDPYLPYISVRWEEGCRNVSQLWRELVERGYRGSCKSLNNYLHRQPAPPLATQPQGRKSAQVRRDTPLMSVPGPRRAVWMLLKPEKLKEAEQQTVENLCRLSPEVAQATELAGSFFQMVRERQADYLSDWIAEVKSSQLPELKAFARGLEQDRAAIEAALREELSNGQTEGQVHRLKLLKRQLYWRAKFDLLRAKVLFAA